MSGSARRKPGTGFSDGITGCLLPPRGKNIRSEKSCIDKICHSSSCSAKAARPDGNNVRNLFLPERDCSCCSPPESVTDPKQLPILFHQIDTVGNHPRLQARGKTGGQVHPVRCALKEDHLRLFCLCQSSDRIRIELGTVDRELSSFDEKSLACAGSECLLCCTFKGIMIPPCQQRTNCILLFFLCGCSDDPRLGKKFL